MATTCPQSKAPDKVPLHYGKYISHIRTAPLLFGEWRHELKTRRIFAVSLFIQTFIYLFIYFGGGGGEGNSHGKKYVLVVFTLPPFKNNHGDGWLLKLSDYPILFFCESQSQREFFRPTEKVFVQINSILFRKYMNGENRNRDKAGAEKIWPLSQLWARLFFCLFLFRYMIQYLHSTGSGAAGNLKSKFENLAREQEEVCWRLPY